MGAINMQGEDVHKSRRVEKMVTPTFLRVHELYNSISCWLVLSICQAQLTDSDRDRQWNLRVYKVSCYRLKPENFGILFTNFIPIFSVMVIECSWKLCLTLENNLLKMDRLTMSWNSIGQWSLENVRYKSGEYRNLSTVSITWHDSYTIVHELSWISVMYHCYHLSRSFDCIRCGTVT